jgi:hypothetical protein
MNKLGFEVGLHYETLGKYCDDNNVDKVTDELLIKCTEMLKQEITDFKKVTGIQIKTAASHGHNKNIQLGTSNNILFEGQEYSKFGIISEAYDREFYEKHVTTHIMDNNILYNYGFSYSANPIESILNGDKVIVLLAHPEHWKYSLKLRIIMLVKIFLGRYTRGSNRVFKRISIKG